MGETTRHQELGALLEALKRRSGQSYQQIGRCVSASKSTVYRYCTGQSVPPDFATIERIAKVCQADKAEMAALHRLWIQAPDDSVEASDYSDVGSGVRVAVAPTYQWSRLDHGRRHRPGARRLTLPSVLAVMMTMLLLGATSGSSGSAREHASPLAAQPIIGPAWARAPVRVQPNLFGVTMNSTTGTMPSFRTGAVRFWDSERAICDVMPRLLSLERVAQAYRD